MCLTISAMRRGLAAKKSQCTLLSWRPDPEVLHVFTLAPLHGLINCSVFFISVWWDTVCRDWRRWCRSDRGGTSVADPGVVFQSPGDVDSRSRTTSLITQAAIAARDRQSPQTNQILPSGDIRESITHQGVSAITAQFLANSGIWYSCFNSARCALSAVIILVNKATSGAYLVVTFMKEDYNERVLVTRYQEIWHPQSASLPGRTRSGSHFTVKLAMLTALVSAQRRPTLQFLFLSNITVRTDAYNYRQTAEAEESGPCSTFIVWNHSFVCYTLRRNTWRELNAFEVHNTVVSQLHETTQNCD